MSEGLSAITTNLAERPPAYRLPQAASSVVNRAEPVRDLEQWQVRAIEKIAALSRLRQNWDSYGSPPVSKRVIDLAVQLIRLSRVDVPTPRVVPISGGGVHFEWSVGSKSFEFEIRGDMSADFLTCQNDAPVNQTPRRSINELLRWLTAA